MQTAYRSILAGVGRRLGKGLLVANNQRPKTLPNTLPLYRGMASKDKCAKEEETEARQGMICKRPDLRKKPIPPYRYGFCRNPDPPMMMSCPPRGKKGSKGPCCEDEGAPKKGGCRKTS